MSMIGWVYPRRSMGLVQAHVHVLLLELKRLHGVVEMKCNQQVAPAGADCVSDTKTSCRDLVSGRCIVQWSPLLVMPCCKSTMRGVKQESMDDKFHLL